MAEIDQTEEVFVHKQLVQLSKSVGIIRSPSACCTGFRVGPNYVMTAKYAIDAIISGFPVPLQLQRQLLPYSQLSNTDVFIDFCYERDGVPTDEDLKFYFEPEIVYANDELDTVVLKLKPDTKEYPPPLTTFSQLPQGISHGYLIGHSEADIKKTDTCNIVTLTPHEIAVAKEWSMKHVSVDGFVGIDSPHHVLFHCSFKKGSGGSPGFRIDPRDGQAYVVLMLLRGYPDWYYDEKYRARSVGIPTRYFVKQGVSMQSVYDDMKKRDESLCKAIFVALPEAEPRCKREISREVQTKRMFQEGNMDEIDLTEAVFVHKQLAQLSKSVGIIRSPAVCCTGFRVGPNYVMTGKYAVDAIIRGVPLQLQRQLLPYLQLSNTDVFIDFCYERDGVPTVEDLKFYFEPEIVYANDELDTVVLKLKPDTKEYPPPLTMFSQLPQGISHRYLIGHSEAGIKKTDTCNIVTLTPHEIAVAKEWSMKHVSVDGFVGIDSPHHVLFHCSFKKGSGGSPGFWIDPRDGQAYVVLMLLRGYPDWYYDDKYKAKSVEIPPRYLVEQGVSMQSVYDDMKKRDESLCKALFEEGLMREERKQPVIEESPTWIIKQGIPLQKRPLPSEKKYHAFFSYSSSDMQWVKKTVETLEKEHGFICCEYDRDITSGTPLLLFADDSIRNAYKTVIVMTKEAFLSEFVLHEIQMAMNQDFIENRKCVVPVLVEDCEIPDYLKALNYVDARDGMKRDIWWPKLLMELEFQAETETVKSLGIENQDGRNTSKDFAQWEEALTAGPDDDSSVKIVDSIRKQGDEETKSWMLWHLVGLLTNRIASMEKQPKFRIWPGTNISVGEITFVCLYKGKLETKLKSFFHIDIFYKSVDTPAPLIDLRNPQDLKWSMPTEEDALLIQSAIEEHGDRLFSKHSNLQVICGGPFLLHERQGFIQESRAVILYCHAKGYVPLGEEKFPSLLHVGGIDIPVDIREGYFALAIADKEWHPRLCMGISIGEKGQKWSGTLGPFVDLGNDDLGFITCAHVVGTEGTDVVQPSEGDIRGQKTLEETICGSVLKRVFNPGFSDGRNGLIKIVGVDAALVKLNKDRPVDPQTFPPVPESELLPMGLTAETKLLYTGGSISCSQESRKIRGKPVIKYGRTSGLRMGLMALEGAMVKISDWEVEYENWKQKHVMKGLYLIGSTGQDQFAERGDSGAGIFLLDEENQLTLIGLVIGVLCAAYDHRCVATPIEYVLRALNVSPDQLRFGEKMDIDT